MTGTMQAIVINKTGGTEVLELVQDYPIPARAEGQDQHAQGTGPLVTLTLVKPDGKQLREILELIAAGKVKQEVAKVFPFSQVAEGHKQVESGRTRGKVVLAVP
eukprot:GHUV01005972.1.p1 GENE.GHUV01005972.1~~GHUV01005972.1.p1  ORF type:complete len:104 (+),score=21.94 GHUV01005972.1:121-432(+)